MVIIADSSLRQEILELEFDALGVASANPSKTWPAYMQAIANPVPPQLEYLRRNAACRSGFDDIMPGTQSILCCAIELPLFRDDTPCHYARFCAIGDYHQVIREQLSKLDIILRKHFPIKNSRICVDTAPVLERELAVRAGLGTIGFNRMVIHPHFGSFIALGELFIDHDLTIWRNNIEINVCHDIPDSAYIPGSCGCCFESERRCIAACPTGALSQAGYDFNRCIAYWTTQHKGMIPAPIDRAIGNCLWGCDRCQNACPRNTHKQPIRKMPDAHPLHKLTIPEILTLSARQLRKRLSGSCIADAHPYMLQRNACIVIANTHDLAHASLLGNIAETHDCDWVRETAKKMAARMEHP